MNRYNSIKKVVSPIIGAGFICSASLLVELFFLRSGVPTLAVLVMSGLVIGALGYSIVFERRKFRDQQRQVLEDRLETVSEMNLHIRNVLGVVAFYGTQTKNIYTTRMVSDALVRMEGIMRGVLSRWGLQANYSTWLSSSRNLHSSPTSPSPTSPKFSPVKSRRRRARASIDRLVRRDALATLLASGPWASSIQSAGIGCTVRRPASRERSGGSLPYFKTR